MSASFLSPSLSSSSAAEIPAHYAHGFEPFVATVREKRPAEAKGQIAGPVTVGMAILGEGGNPILYDDVLRDVLVKFLHLRVRWEAERLRKARGVEVLPLGLDQRQFPEVAQMAQRALGWKGRIDVLINNAGGGTPGEECRFFERSPEHMADLIARNLTGMMYCCREVGKIMAKQGSGKIINIASIAALVGRDRRMYARGKLMEQALDYA